MGRPKLYEDDRKTISVRIAPDLLAKLHKAAGRRQVETGEPVSLAALMISVLEEFAEREEQEHDGA